MALQPQPEARGLVALQPLDDSIALRQVSLMALHLRDQAVPLQPPLVDGTLMGLQPQGPELH